MENKFKIIIAVVVVVILAIIAGFFFINNSEKTMEANGAIITLPSDYELDFEKGVATKDDVTITFTGVMGDTQYATDMYKAISANGAGSGYVNASNNTINGFKEYEYAAKADNRTVLKYGSSTEWTEYSPINFTDVTGQRIDCDHFRIVDYITPNNSSIIELVIFGKNPDTDLYSDEITKIVDSISLTTE